MHPTKVRHYTCDKARPLSQVWGVEPNTSLGYKVAGPPHHHHIITAFLCRCLYQTDQTHQDSCASLWRSRWDTHAFKPDKNQFNSHNFLLGYLTKLHHYLLSVTFCLPQAARSSLVMLSLGWLKGSRQDMKDGYPNCKTCMCKCGTGVFIYRDIKRMTIQ